MNMMQDGVDVYCLPEGACCNADKERRSPLDLEECPQMEEVCTGDCPYYSEDNRKSAMPEQTITLRSSNSTFVEIALYKQAGFFKINENEKSITYALITKKLNSIFPYQIETISISDIDFNNMLIFNKEDGTVKMNGCFDLYTMDIIIRRMKELGFHE